MEYKQEKKPPQVTTNTENALHLVMSLTISLQVSCNPLDFSFSLSGFISVFAETQCVDTWKYIPKNPGYSKTTDCSDFIPAASL